MIPVDDDFRRKRFKKGERELYLNNPELKSRGWTDSLIKMLGEPDRLGVNPNYKSGPPVRYFLLQRVEAMEATNDFRKAQVKAKKRSVASKKRSDEAEAALIEQIEKEPIVVPQLDDEQLIRESCESYNAWNSGNEHFVPAGPSSGREFLDRICVNYLRHKLTPYERQLEDVYGRMGAVSARELIRDRILDAIEESYPALGAACSEQRERYRLSQRQF